jgi:cytochrome b561
MRPDRSTHRYTIVAIILHWVMALGIAVLAVMGWIMVHLKLDPMRLFELYQLHKSIGITVLMTAVLRLGWRLAHQPPPLPASMPLIERRAAAGSHLILYLFLFALPITGWALVSSAVLNIPTVLYGVIPWPDLPILSTLHNKAPVEAVLETVHAYGAYALIALVGFHAMAALRHHFIIKDDILLRILPAFCRSRKPSVKPARTEGPFS